MTLRSLLGTTKSRVFDYLVLRKHTAKEVATRLDIQVTAVRKHLESLKTRGLIKEEFVVEGVGRPKKFYTLTGTGRELLQNQNSAVLSLVLTEIEKDQGAESAYGVMSQAAKEIAVPMHGSESEKNNIESLTKSLDKFGFETSFEENEKSYSIISRYCPLHDNAKNHQKLICHGLHDEVIKSALGIDAVRLEKCMALGDDFCRHVIPKQE